VNCTNRIEAKGSEPSGKDEKVNSGLGRIRNAQQTVDKPQTIKTIWNTYA
jgi:hypothetical protein